MEQAVRTGDIQKIKLTDIIVGDRARFDMGDIESLALSIQMEGQLLPIIVDIGEGGKYNLVEGERRIKAMRSLGSTQIEAILLEKLSPIKRKELEIVHCVQRQQLNFIEEARAVKDLVDRRKTENLQGGIAKFGKSIRNKDVARELNMTEARMSENLRIASAVDDHPEMEAASCSRSEFLRKVRNREFFVPDGGQLQTTYKENFMHTTPQGCLETINDKIIDLAILHPDRFDKDLLVETHKRLKVAGQIIVFCDHKDIGTWEEELKAIGMNVGDRPYIWHKKKIDDYANFIWSAKNMISPIRPITNMISAAPESASLSPKAKPMQLVTNIIRCCTERGGFVVVPCCEDIETVRCCVELNRNIRAATGNKILRDRLILSVVQEENK